MLLQGETDAAFDALLANKKIRQADSSDERERLALVGWLEHRQGGINSPTLERRNRSRQRLNLVA